MWWGRDSTVGGLNTNLLFIFVRYIHEFITQIAYRDKTSKRRSSRGHDERLVGSRREEEARMHGVSLFA